MYESDIEAADRCIRTYTNRANAREDMAHYLLEQAAEDRAMALYWQTERDRFLGKAGIENVIPLRSEAEQGDIA